MQKYSSYAGKISICLFFWLVSFGYSNAQTYDFKEMARRIKTELLDGYTPDTTKLNALVSSQNSDGSWSNLNYGKLRVREKMSDGHLVRILQLTKAVADKNSTKYNDKAYFNAISQGLIFWHSSHTVAINWWYNKIFFPQELGKILILLHDFDLHKGNDAIHIDEGELIRLFEPQGIRGILSHASGANAIDIATHYVYRGILTENSKVLEEVRDVIYSTLTDKIGADLIYKDHGPQIQISSYGLVYCSGLMHLAAILAGSPAAFDVKSEKFGKVLQFIREVQIASIRGKSWDFSVMGRAVSRGGALRAHLPYLQYLADYIDPENAHIYLDALARTTGKEPANYKIREFNKQYWNSDYMQQVRRGYLFTVRNTSTRTVEAEQGNWENTSAQYFSYGATFLSIDGSEYMNLMHSWDWAMIPGTTFAYTKSLPFRRDWGFNPGKTSFVGGVSDGTYGASTLDLDRYSVTAKKSWFFFENELVCLGAGITDDSSRSVRTTVNQTWLQSDIWAKTQKNDKEIAESEENTIHMTTHPTYIRHGKMAYFFPEPERVCYAITPALAKNRQSADMFCLWIDHGMNPTDASYSYIVVPNVDSQEKAKSYHMSAIEIVCNTSKQQAVYHKKLKIFEAIFHQAGTLKFKGNIIRVDKPCALMIRGDKLTVSDPSQSISKVTIGFNAKTQTILLPVIPGMRGSSVSMKLED
ncbi:MAG: polysaccharide lyase family 8 super-sandwich domain-containing protein [Mangrovibacterium sp.]